MTEEQQTQIIGDIDVPQTDPDAHAAWSDIDLIDFLNEAADDEKGYCCRLYYVKHPGSVGGKPTYEYITQRQNQILQADEIVGLVQQPGRFRRIVTYWERDARGALSRKTKTREIVISETAVRLYRSEEGSGSAGGGASGFIPHQLPPPPYYPPPPRLDPKQLMEYVHGIAQAITPLIVAFRSQGNAMQELYMDMNRRYANMIADAEQSKMYRTGISPPQSDEETDKSMVREIMESALDLVKPYIEKIGRNMLVDRKLRKQIDQDAPEEIAFLRERPALVAEEVERLINEKKIDREAAERIVRTLKIMPADPPPPPTEPEMSNGMPLDGGGVAFHAVGSPIDTGKNGQQ